jgi:hypothetical protein
MSFFSDLASPPVLGLGHGRIAGSHCLAYEIDGACGRGRGHNSTGCFVFRLSGDVSKESM